MSETNEFMLKWEDYLETASQDEIKRLLSQTSPHHPKQNMRWLYDRLLYKLAGVDLAS